MLPPDHPISKWHALFCELTGADLPLGYIMEERWAMWRESQPPLTPGDLKLLIWYKRKMIREQGWGPQCLGFFAVIGDVEKARDMISIAKSLKRNQVPKVTPRQSVLNAAGYEEDYAKRNGAFPIKDWLAKTLKAVEEAQLEVKETQ